jgi:hypothetical protein
LIQIKYISFELHFIYDLEYISNYEQPLYGNKIRKYLMRYSLNISQKAAMLALAGMMGLASFFAMSQEARADWRYRNNGGAVAAGVVGGLAVGTLLGAAASRPAYGAPMYAAPAYAQPVYEEEPVVCQWRRRKVWVDPYTYQVQRYQVCN